MIVGLIIGTINYIFPIHFVASALNGSEWTVPSAGATSRAATNKDASFTPLVN